MALPIRTTVRLAAIGIVATGLVTATLLTSQSRSQSGESPSEPSSVVARVGDQNITLREVEQAAALSLYQLDQQRNRLLQQALQRRIDDILLQNEASKRGTTVDQILTKASQSGSISKMADIPAPVRKLSMKGSANEVGGDLAQDLQESSRVRQALLVSLRRKTDILVTLPIVEPPVLPVSVDDEPSVGPSDAPITIVEFSDFQCPYCQKSVGVLKVLTRLYGEKIRIVYRDYPGPNHPEAVQAAEAAQCANESGKFWEYHDLLFERQTAGGGWDYGQLAKELGLQEEAFTACLKSGRYRHEVLKDVQDGLQFGISSTPTFFINGRPIVGAQTVSDFQSMIDPLLNSLETSKPSLS